MREKTKQRAHCTELDELRVEVRRRRHCVEVLDFIVEVALGLQKLLGLVGELDAQALVLVDLLLEPKQ